MTTLMLILCIIMAVMFLLLGVAVSPMFLIGVIVAALLFFWHKKSTQAVEQKKIDAALKQQQEQERRAMHEKELKERFYHFDIAGIFYHQDEASAVLDEDGYYMGVCHLIPEPDNPHDKNAIKVMIKGKQVGYVPATQCAVVAAKMKKAVEITAELQTTNEIEGTVTLCMY